MDVDEGTPQPNTQDQVVKKLIRYALACEYQRVTIKRAGITEKGEMNLPVLFSLCANQFHPQ